MFGNPFTGDAFGSVSLTNRINNQQYAPSGISGRGWFDEQGVATTNLALDVDEQRIVVLEVAPRGADGKVITADKPTVHPFIVPHIPAQGSVRADEVLNSRAVGTSDQPILVDDLLNRQMRKMRRSMDYTIEYHRLLAVMGNYVNVNGVQTSLFTAFDMTQTTVAMAITNAATKHRQKALEIYEAVEAALDGVAFQGIQVLAGKAFWRDWIEAKDVKDAWIAAQRLTELTRDPRTGFEFGEIRWDRYRGDSLVKIPDDEAYAVPVGVDDLFLTKFGPADAWSEVGFGAMGLPYYVFSEMMKYGKGVEFQGQSNPLNICTRPGAIIKLTK